MLPGSVQRFGTNSPARIGELLGTLPWAFAHHTDVHDRVQAEPDEDVAPGDEKDSNGGGEK